MLNSLLDAIRSGDAGQVASLCVPEILSARADGAMTALMCAAGSGRTQIVAALLAAGADVNAADDRGFTPLLHGCYNANEDRGYPDVQVVTFLKCAPGD